MAPSSLMKMSGDQVRSEGNYASFEKMQRVEFTNCDLGLTLLPGSQTHKSYEKEARTAAEGSLEELGSKYAGRGEQWKSFETDIRSKTRAQEAGLSNKVTNPSSFLESGPQRAKLSLGTAQVNQDEPNSQSKKQCSGGKLQGTVKSVVVAPSNEQVTDTIEIQSSESCQCDEFSPRAAKRRRSGRSGSRETIGRQDLRISNGNQEARRANSDQFHGRHEQDLSGVNSIHAEKGETLGPTVDVPFSGNGGDWGPRKQQPRTQVPSSSAIVVAHYHQSTILGFKELALRDDASIPVASSSRPSRKQQHAELEELTVHDQSSIFSKSLSAQYRKHPCLFLEVPTKIRKQMLKPIDEVNRSWTSHFPAKAKILRSANLPAPFLRVTRLTPREDRHEAHQNTVPLTSTNLRNYTHSSSTCHLPPLSTYLRLAEAFNHLSDAGDLAHAFDTAHTGQLHQSSRRRSASLPKLASSCVPLDMHSSNNFGPSSIPTPPREQPSFPVGSSSSNLLSHSEAPPFCQTFVGFSHSRADATSNTGDSLSLPGQFNSKLQRESKISRFGSPSSDFTSRPQSRHIVAQLSKCNNMASLSTPIDLAVAPDGPLFRRRPLEIKPNYSYEEVKSLLSNLIRETKTLKAVNINLQSTNTAMKKDSESFQRDQASLNQKIQHQEETIAQKDQQIKAMRQYESSLQHHYRTIYNDYQRLDNDYQGLVANIRKANGFDKPSEVARKIRLDHSRNAIGTASQSGQPREKSLLRDCIQCVPSLQPNVAAVGSLATNEQIHERVTEQLLTNPVTIDLTDDSGPSSAPAPQDTSTHLSSQTQMPPSQQMPDQESQSDDSGSGQTGKGARARTAQERCSWLPGANPYKGIEAQARLSNSRLPLTGGANGQMQCPQTGRVAPLPRTATGRRTKEAPKKTNVVLDHEAKKERQRAYRKTAAEKKKREKEGTKRVLEAQSMPSNAVRAFKQDRRAVKERERQNQARKPSEESGSLEPQKTLDGRLYQESTHNGNDAGQEQDETAALAAELEAELEAMLDEESKTDANAEEMEGVESIDAASDQTPFPSTLPDGDDRYHDLFSESEEE
ncbi:hypothetical protein BDR22DRAFT_863187 [Usnea florida]